MATYQLIVTARTTGHQPPKPEVVQAQGGDIFNANLNTPGGTTLAASSATPLVAIGRALRASGASLDALYEVRYHAGGMLAACATVRDMLRAHPHEAMPA
jgi:hypothetical protein